MCWLNRAESDFKSIPLVYHGWLTSKECMSIACENAGYTFVVEVLEHGICSTHESQYFVRKVLIRVNNIASLYAVTEAPMKTYWQYQDIFDDLGNNPIGASLLFKPEVVKQPSKYKKIVFGDSAFGRDLIKYNPNKEVLFARKDVFDIKTFPLSLIQIPLPNILLYPGD